MSKFLNSIFPNTPQATVEKRNSSVLKSILNNHELLVKIVKFETDWQHETFFDSLTKDEKGLLNDLYFSRMPATELTTHRLHNTQPLKQWAHRESAMYNESERRSYSEKMSQFSKR